MARVHQRHKIYSRYSKNILFAELVWPIPLLAVGLLQNFQPLAITVAILLAITPWLIRLFGLGYFTRSSGLGWPLALLAAGTLISLWPSYDITLSLPVLFVLLGSIGLFFAIVNTSILPWPVAQSIVVMAAAMAVYFIGQYAHFHYPPETETWQAAITTVAVAISRPVPKIVLFVPHVNGVASFVEGALFVNLALLRLARGRRQKAVWLATLALMLLALLFSISRGAWLGVLLALFIGGILALPAQNRLRLVVITVAGIGLAAIAAGWLLPAHSGMVGDTLSAAKFRLELYLDSLYLLGDYPFTGIGLGDTFAMIYSKYQLLIAVPFLSYTHNLFLTVGLALGVFGLVALGWLVLAFFSLVWRAEDSDWHNQRDHALFRAAWLGVVAHLGHGLTDATQFSNSLWAMPMLLAMFALVAVLGRNGVFRDARESGRRAWRGAVVAVGLLLAAGGCFGASGWYANLGAVYQTRADLAPNLTDSARQALQAQAVAYYRRALDINPNQPTANRRLGQMALDAQNFDEARQLLEQAYARQPGNQATLKALGLVYVWAGQLDAAEPLLRRRHDISEVAEELGNWSNWWATQNRPDLARYARQMEVRLNLPP